MTARQLCYLNESVYRIRTDGYSRADFIEISRKFSLGCIEAEIYANFVIKFLQIF